MIKHIGIVVLAALIIGSLVTYIITYQVDEMRDIVLIETFGKVTQDGSSNKAGLYFKWPWPIQKVIRYESRAFIFEDTYEDVPTKDKQDLLVTMYCAWRIAKPVQFHRVLRTNDIEEKVEQVEVKLREMVRNAKKDVVGRYNMVAFVNTDPEKMLLAEIESEIETSISSKALEHYGVQIVRVGIKSLGLPQEVTRAVISAMKEERQRDVKRFESEGEARAKAIEARAEADRDQILAFAERKAKEIRTEGDQAAAKYYKRFGEDEDFSNFLRRLESLKKELAGKTVMFLDGGELQGVRYFRQGPTVSDLSKDGSDDDD